MDRNGICLNYRLARETPKYLKNEIGRLRLVAGQESMIHRIVQELINL